MAWKFLNNPDPDRSRLELCLLAGILLVQYWAQVFNMGEVYGGGKVISASILFGPMLGLIFPWIAALVTFFLRKLLPSNRTKKTSLKESYAYLAHALRPLAIMGTIQLIELVFFGESAFHYKWDVFMVLKTVLVVGALVLWFLYTRRLLEGWKLWPAMASVSLLSGFSISFLIFWGIFGLPMVS